MKFNLWSFRYLLLKKQKQRIINGKRTEWSPIRSLTAEYYCLLFLFRFANYANATECNKNGLDGMRHLGVRQISVRDDESSSRFPNPLTKRRRVSDSSILFRNLRFTRINGRCRFLGNRKQEVYY